MSESKPARSQGKPLGSPLEARPYRLEDQIGFVIRQASQRHTAIFAKLMIDQLTPTQWAALVKIAELQTVSQNQLGRLTAMDAATIKGVVDRLIKRGFVTVRADPEHGRKSVIAQTAAGRRVVEAGLPVASDISEETWKTLTPGERLMLVELLRKIA